MKKIGILGSGQVGKVLANGFLKHGYEVMIGSRSPEKLAEFAAESGAQTGDFGETAAFGDALVLAVSGRVAVEALQLAGAAHLAGKLIMDATNPIAETPPVNGVLPFFTDYNLSLMEILQEKFADARFVKVFSCVGNANMVNPDFGGEKPTMFICGDDEAAKADVTRVLDQFGWETADMGAREAARAIEPLCILWCITGFRGEGWTHAFKMLKR